MSDSIGLLNVDVEVTWGHVVRGDWSRSTIVCAQTVAIPAIAQFQQRVTDT